MDLLNRDIETADEARDLICELGRRFYALGWVSGTGGGISLRLGDRVFMAASGVQKEALDRDSIFELDLAGNVIAEPPTDRGFKCSACRPLFLAAMNQRGARAVIHSHSMHAMLATLRDDDRFRVTQLEMMKGIAGVGFYDEHEVPVIDNTAHEEDLAESLTAAIDAFPAAQAVLVRRHGVYVWGDSWLSAKRHAECYDYLFRASVEMARLGHDAARAPDGQQLSEVRRVGNVAE